MDYGRPRGDRDTVYSPSPGRAMRHSSAPGREPRKGHPSSPPPRVAPRDTREAPRSLVAPSTSNKRLEHPPPPRRSVVRGEKRGPPAPLAVSRTSPALNSACWVRDCQTPLSVGIRAIAPSGSVGCGVRARDSAPCWPSVYRTACADVHALFLVIKITCPHWCAWLSCVDSDWHLLIPPVRV